MISWSGELGEVRLRVSRQGSLEPTVLGSFGNVVDGRAGRLRRRRIDSCVGGHVGLLSSVPFTTQPGFR